MTTPTRIPRSGLAPLKLPHPAACEQVHAFDGRRFRGQERNRWYEVELYRWETDDEETGQTVTLYAVHVGYRTQWQGEAEYDWGTMGPAEHVAEWLAAIQPVPPAVGFPAGEQYAARQAALVEQLAVQYAAAVSEVLDRDEFAVASPAAAPSVEHAPPSNRDAAGYSLRWTSSVPRHYGGESMIDAWAMAAIAPCPACGGRLLWAEAGYVPGYRICQTCGRPWIVRPVPGPDRSTGELRLEIPQTDTGPAWSYTAPADPEDAGEEAYNAYCQQVVRFHGQPAARSTWEAYQR